jgi:hypothetical protein
MPACYHLLQHRLRVVLVDEESNEIMATAIGLHDYTDLGSAKNVRLKGCSLLILAQ